MTAAASPSKNKKLYQCLGGLLDGLTVEASEIKEGVFRAPVVGKTHDFGNDERHLVWMRSKTAFKDCDVVYKLDGNKLVYSHREGSL